MTDRKTVTPKLNNKIRIITVCLLCFVLCCCGKNDNAVYELLTFRTEVQNNCRNYSTEDWEDALNKYTDICQKLDEMPLTNEERLEVEKIKGEIAGYAASVAAQDISNEIQTIATEIGAFAKGFSNTFKLQDEI